MDVLLSAVVSELVGRLVSFLIGQYCQQEPAGATVRLRRALLRARAIVDEAEGRHIANRAMLLQLRGLRRELCRDAYALDGLVTAGSSGDGIAVAVESLEAALSDVREFVVLLGACPRVTRQPYNAYLFMEICMFGRQVEKEQLVTFLLQPTTTQDLDVLPIIGPHDVGKRTLVEHVLLDERVRGHFAEVHRLSLSGVDLDLPSHRDRDHHHRTTAFTDAAAARRSTLFVIDLADGDAACEDSLRRLRSSITRHGASRGRSNSKDDKAILISRTESHSVLGTAPPLRLCAPRREELWYLFKGLAFGGADPEDRPDLVRVAVALFEAFVLHVSPFTTVHNLCASLRANMSAALTVRWPRKPAGFCFLICRPVKGAAGTPLLFKDRRKLTGMAGEDLPKVTMNDLMTGRAAVPVGEPRFDALVWRSRIPPYSSYVWACDVEGARRVVAGETGRVRRKRKRDWV